MNGARSGTPWAMAVPIGGSVLLGYFVLLGGTPVGGALSSLAILNSLLAGVVIVYYVIRAPTRSDSLDIALLASVILFAVAGVLSTHPRQSMDAVLAALVWTCALFLVRDQARTPAVRNAIPVVLMALSAIVTVSTAIRWLPVLNTWWSVTGIAAPPLDLDYPGMPWGHWHDLSLLGVMLYPAWWTGRPSMTRRITAIALGVLVVAIALVDGSRNVWLASIGATAVVSALIASRRSVVSPRVMGAMAATAVVAATLLWVTGAGAALLSRAFDLSPLDMRGALWGASVQAWLSVPIAGIGPGSFPWALQETTYFDTNSLAPRHPDSLLFQLLPEAGLLGVAAVAIVMLAVIPRVLRSSELPATWALLVFGLAGVGANPSDFGFFIAVAIAWLAMAVPHPAQTSSQVSPSRPLQVATLGCLALIGAAQAMTLTAHVSYERASDFVAQGHQRDALAALSTAVRLDPGQALYARQRGILEYQMGDLTEAAKDLRAATDLNSADDLAWRSLALALRDAGEEQDASAALDEAVRLQRSDPTNLLLRASWQATDGHLEASAATLAEIVHAWPAVIAAQGWEDVLPEGLTTADIIAEAAIRWDEDVPSPERQGGQGVWLTVLGDRADLLPRALSGSSASPSLDDLTLAVFTCDRRASALLESASTSDRRTFLYWLLRVRDSAIRGQPDADALRVVAAWGGQSLTQDEALTTMNPFHENDANGFSADIWGYRRLPIDWPPGTTQLPSPWAGAARWLVDPIGATEAADVEGRVPACTTE